MSSSINIDHGYTEATIVLSCDFDMFYKVATTLEEGFSVSFTKVHDFDTLYWEFEWKEQHLVLYYNIYLDIKIYPKSLMNASMVANAAVIEVSSLLYLQGYRVV